jgi:RNA polymerase sigma factor (sigma-70 family)
MIFCHLDASLSHSSETMNTQMNHVAVLDADLVEQSRAGDATAFGKLVERHQSLVCALALGACGDLHRSEDIAQEAFVGAWRQLAELKESEKFKSWVCGIARNIANSSIRQDGRRLTAQVDNECCDEAQVEAATPADHAIDSEERAILLRHLQEMPTLYREPMVLFYRQNKSVASVAEVLGVSEDAVKQRLSRGRVMLAERVERALGSVLRRTVPSAAFTLAVMGVLAASTTTASAAAATGAGAKLAKGSVLGGALAVPFITWAAGMWGLFRSQTQSARTPRERRFAVWTLGAAILLGFAISLVFGMRGIGLMAGSSWLVDGSLLAGVLVQSAAFAFGFWIYRRRQRIRMEDGLSPEAARSVWRMEPEDKGFWPGVIGFAVVLGSACNLPHILVVLYWVKTLVIALPLVLAGFAVAAMVRWPREWRRVLMVLIGTLFLQYAGLTAYMWQQWSQSKEAWQHSIPIIAIQSFYLGVWIVMVIGCYLYWRSEKWGHKLHVPGDPAKDEVWR